MLIHNIRQTISITRLYCMRENRLCAEGAFSSEGDSESIVDELERGARLHAGGSDLTPSRAREKRCASWCGCSCNVRALDGPL